MCTLTIHMVARYPTLPRVALPWDGMWFGFIGNIVGPTAQLVEFPGATAFKLVPVAVRMPMLATMEAQWIATGAVPFLPLFGLADSNTELIHTQCSALLPFMAVHCCLTLMSMQQLWTVLGQPLLDGGQEVEMGILLDCI